MAKRNRFGSKGLAPQSTKRTKSSHQIDEVEVLQDKLLEPSLITGGCMTDSNKESTLDTTEISPPISQHERKESTISQPEYIVSTSENGQKSQENRRPRLSFFPVLQMPSLTWLTVPQQTVNIPLYMHPLQTPSRPKPRLPTPPPKTKAMQRITERGRALKKPKLEPATTIYEGQTTTRGFTIYEDETATRSNITEIEDENFSFALADAHEFVEAYMQKESFLYGERLVEYILPLAKTCEVAAEEEGATFEKKLMKWKLDNRWNYWEAAGRGGLKSSRGRHWFTAESVEQLAELLEATVRAGDPNKVEREDDTEEELQAWVSNALMICGYCQGKGIEGEKRKGKEHYDCLGHAWKRIIGLQQFDDDIWSQSQDKVSRWEWHNKMMWKVVRSEGWTEYAELLKTRWKVPSNHPMAPVRRPLQETTKSSVNGLSGDDETEADFEEGLD
jgi:hypothetical protein